jgi:hypothetical protein
MRILIALPVFQGKNISKNKINWFYQSSIHFPFMKKSPEDLFTNIKINIAIASKIISINI